MPIRLAATGISHWHALYDPAYLRQLARMPEVEIVGVQDPDPRVAARRAAEIGNPPVFAGYREMLRETRPDFVLALGRHDAMAELAHHLLDHGFPFLMEKPMGLNAEEVLGIVEKVDAKRAFVAVPMPQRYSPFLRQAQRMLSEGRFGALSHIYIRCNRASSARYAAWDSGWMLDPAAAGGGCLRNLGSHGFDMFLQLTGEEAEVTGAQISSRALGERVEDFASVLLRSRGGVLGTIEVGNTYPRRLSEEGLSKIDRLLDAADGEWKIVGRDALLAAKDGQLLVVTADREETLPGEPTESQSHAILRDALQRWQAGDPPSVGVQDCYRSVRLIDAAYRLAQRPT